MFRSRVFLKLDPKGRLSIPSQYRANIDTASGLYITNSIIKGRRFLDCYSKSEWQTLERKISKLSKMKAEVVAFQRFYLSSVEVCAVDSQARILIPQHLRAYANLGDDIVLVGVGNKFEIWDVKTWAEHFKDLENNFESTLAKLADIEDEDKKRK